MTSQAASTSLSNTACADATLRRGFRVSSMYNIIWIGSMRSIAACKCSVFFFHLAQACSGGFTGTASSCSRDTRTRITRGTSISRKTYHSDTRTERQSWDVSLGKHRHGVPILESHALPMPAGTNSDNAQRRKIAQMGSPSSNRMHCQCQLARTLNEL